MSSDPYNATVRRLFAAPTHAGSIDGGVAADIDDQGVHIRLTARVADGHIAKCAFLVRGCPHTIAAAEAACRALEGGIVADLETFSAAELMKSLAVPAEKSSRILVVEDAVRSLGNAARHRQN